jgi:ABC-type branched-subunit amino acid transport system substrate-binding protein
MRVRLAAVASLAVTVAASVAGCGSSNNGAPPNGGAATQAAAASDAHTPSGPPINAWFLSDLTGLPGTNFNQLGVGAQAAAKYINSKDGGVDGRPVEINICDTKNDPGATLTCANQAIQAGATFIGGLSLNYGTNALARVAAAKIPSMTGPASQQESTNPTSFPPDGGTVTQLYAGARWLAAQRPKSLGILYLDIPSAHLYPQVTEQVFKQAGLPTKITAVAVSPTTVDLSPAVATVMQAKPDWILLAVANSATAWEALKQAGYTGKTLTGSNSEDVPGHIGPAGAAADGQYMTPEFDSFDDTRNPEVALYRAAMGSSPLARAAFSQQGFATVMTAYAAMKQIKGAVTGASLLAFLSKVPRLHVFMGGDMAAASAPKIFPAIRTVDAVRIVQWKNGKVVNVAGPLNGSPTG